MMAEIVNLNTYRKVKRNAEQKKKVAKNLARFREEKVEQRRREYEEAGMQGRSDGKWTANLHQKDNTKTNTLYIFLKMKTKL